MAVYKGGWWRRIFGAGKGEKPTGALGEPVAEPVDAGPSSSQSLPEPHPVNAEMSPEEMESVMQGVRLYNAAVQKEQAESKKLEIELELVKKASRLMGQANKLQHEGMCVSALKLKNKAERLLHPSANDVAGAAKLMAQCDQLISDADEQIAAARSGVTEEKIYRGKAAALMAQAQKLLEQDKIDEAAGLIAKADKMTAEADKLRPAPESMQPSARLQAWIEQMRRDPADTAEVLKKMEREDPESWIEVHQWMQSERSKSNSDDDADT